MSRVKRGNVSRKRHKKVLELAKGYRGPLSKLYRPARQAVINALCHAYNDRRNKRGEFRALWNVRIGAALAGRISYSKFIGALHKQGIQLNRKMLSSLAIENPAIFDQIVAVAEQ
ncbi:MAG: 50S ribosomal protein L20 [Candidatus Margulisiibacteriota bacterium]